jgi:YHS domain-containing protein
MKKEEKKNNGMVLDVVCRMYLITTDGFYESEVDGEKYYFCCDKCKAEFDKHPQKYIEGYISHDEGKKFSCNIKPGRGVVIQHRHAHE